MLEGIGPHDMLCPYVTFTISSMDTGRAQTNDAIHSTAAMMTKNMKFFVVACSWQRTITKTVKAKNAMNRILAIPPKAITNMVALQAIRSTLCALSSRMIPVVW